MQRSRSKDRIPTARDWHEQMDGGSLAYHQHVIHYQNNSRYQPVLPHPLPSSSPFSLFQVRSLLVLVVLPLLNLSIVGSEGREGDRIRSMSETPPPFQEASRCDVCHCSFTTFRRRHHCRCCGRTLCNEHSSNQMALPQFGIYTNVRVCYDCFNKTSWSGKDDKQTSQSATAAVTDAISRLHMNEDTVSLAKSTSGDETVGVPECKCGMPLCICEVPTPDPAPLPMKNSTVSTLRSNPRPKKAISTQQSAESVPKKLPSSSSSHQSSFFNVGQASNGSLDKGHADYDVSGEGLREAIKNSDATAVKELLIKGVDANYCDRQGLSLLHLAAVFNQTEIAFILLDHGASMECKNAQGETPLDCAPTMLQYKMREKMQALAGNKQPTGDFVN